MIVQYVAMTTISNLPQKTVVVRRCYGEFGECNVVMKGYGVTGKTFTMEGIPENRGVNFRALEELFRVTREREGHTEYR